MRELLSGLTGDHETEEIQESFEQEQGVQEKFSKINENKCS
jgi:hypothetical protein